MKKLILCLLMLTACKEKSEPIKKSNWDWKTIEVTASAYNSVTWQTTSTNPNIAAWGDTLRPGMNCIAVSRDLLYQGLRHNTMVMIDTFPDTFYVKDKMNRRWKNRIDIYMGKDIKKAREWGKRKLSICYAIPIDTITSSK